MRGEGLFCMVSRPVFRRRREIKLSLSDRRILPLSVLSLKPLPRVFFACITAACLSLTACGRVGNIRPPEATAPAPVQYFTADGQAGGVLLTWQNPTLDASGGELKSLDRYYVERSDYTRGGVPDFTTIAQLVPPTDPAEAEPKEEQDKKKGALFGGGGASGRLLAPMTYLDNSAEPGKRYDYRVVAVTESGVRGRSDLILRVSFEGAASRIENIAVQLRK